MKYLIGAILGGAVLTGAALVSPFGELWLMAGLLGVVLGICWIGLLK